MMSTVRTFKVPNPVSGEYNHALLGRIAYSFPAGTVTPASEQEEIALEEALVPAGLATRGDDEPREIVAHSFPAENAGADGLEAMTVGELRTVAGDEGIDLGGAKRKADIVEAITAARAGAPATPDTSDVDERHVEPDVEHDTSDPEPSETGDE